MANSKYRVCVPNTPPETGRSSTGKEYTSSDKAIEEAKQIAEKGGPRSAVYVEEVDGVNTWSVQYRPEPPQFLGLASDGTANVEWPVEFRVVHDPTYQEGILDEEGTIVESRTVGKSSSTDFGKE